MAIRIITDGACDLETEYLKLHDVTRVPFYVSFDGKTYKKEIEEIGVRDFYQRMKDEPKVYPRTSLPAVNDYISTFEKYLEDGDDIICICFTSHLSGSLNSASNAKMIIEEDVPDAKIHVVNSLCGTVTQGSLVAETVRMRDAGLSFEEISENLERIKMDAKIFFTVDNLDYLIHGGRIGRITGRAASALNVKPMIVLDKGEVTSGGIARSRKKSLVKCLNLMDDFLQKRGKSINDYILNVGFGYNVEEGKNFYQKVVEHVKELGYEGEVQLTQIGATIAVHTGPGAIGVGVVPKYDRN